MAIVSTYLHFIKILFNYSYLSDNLSLDSTYSEEEMLQNLATILVSTLISWLSINYFVYKYDQVDKRHALIIYSDNYKKDKNYIPRSTPYAFSNNSIAKKIDMFKKKKLLSKNFSLFNTSIQTPLGSKPNGKMIYCQEDDGWYISELDKYGFSNPNKVWDNEIEVLLIGDSFAQGACTEKNAQYHLNNLGVNTISLGMGGNGPLTELASLKEFYKKHHTKNVFWLIFENDIFRRSPNKLPIDFVMELGNPILKKYYDDPNFSQDYFNLEKLNGFSKNFDIFNEAYYKANIGNIKKQRRYHKNRQRRLILDLAIGTFLTKRLNNLKKAFNKTNNSPIKEERKNKLFKKKQQGLSEEHRLMVLNVYDRAVKLAKKNGSNIQFIFLHSLSKCANANYKNDHYGFIKKYFIKKNFKFSDFKIGEKLPQCRSYFARKQGSHYNSRGYKALGKHIIDNK